MTDHPHATGSPMVRPLTGEELLAALDLALDEEGSFPQLREFQEAFWAARREWEDLKAAYEMVVCDLVKRMEPRA